MNGEGVASPLMRRRNQDLDALCIDEFYGRSIDHEVTALPLQELAHQGRRVFAAAEFGKVHLRTGRTAHGATDLFLIGNIRAGRYSGTASCFGHRTNSSAGHVTGTGVKKI